MSSPDIIFPHFSPPPVPPPASKPPPPSHPLPPPPPPHILPPPPPSPPGHHSTVIIIVFVAFGGLFFLAFLLIALCYFGKKIWKKKKTIQETDIVRFDEHMRIKEAVVQGPHGAEAVVLSMEDDVHVEEEIRKNEKVGAGMHAKSAEITPKALEEGESSSISGHNYPEH